MILPFRFLATALVTLVLSAVSSRAAVVTPYVNDFDSTAVGSTPSDFSSSGGTWSVTGSGSDHAYQVTANTSTAMTTGVQVSDLGASLKDFTLTSTFTITDLSNVTSSTIGFGLLSNYVNFANNYYLADISQAGAIRIVYFEGGAAQSNGYGGFTANTATNLASALVLGTEYTMTLTGTYTGSSLALNFTVTDSINTASVTAVDTSAISAAGSNYFGYRLRQNGTGGDAFTVEFDNLSIVPEPTGLSLLGVGMFGLLALRRSKRHA